MAEEGGIWRQRYETAREAMQIAEKEHREFAAELVRAVHRLSIAAEGRDEALDGELQGLRALVKLKDLSRDVLASKLDLLDEHVRELTRKTLEPDPRLREAIEVLLDQVTASAPRRETQRAAESLRRELHGSGTDALGVLARAVALREQPAVQAQRIPPSASAESRGLLARLFERRSGGADRRKTAPATGDADGRTTDQPEPPPTTRIGEGASRALRSLAETLRPPADDDLNAVFEALSQRIAGGIRDKELLGSFEDLRVLAGAALARSRDEFGSFLVGIQSRLIQTTEALGSGNAREAGHAEEALQLQEAMQAGLQGMREGVAKANAIEELKRDLDRQIEGVGRTLDAYRERERRILEERAVQARTLDERVRELQQQAERAERELAEQRRLALTDTLTQLPNREAWQQRLVQEYDRWRRYGRPLSVAMCDIDHFKSINDSYGHAGGDAVLQRVASCLQERLREADFIARIGGEEFVILLPETTAEQAGIAMDAVRTNVSLLSISMPEGSTARVTASIGIASFVEGDDIDRAFTRADSALYQAKREGRDRVTVYSGAIAAKP
jgi:diguanylate cyclase